MVSVHRKWIQEIGSAEEEAAAIEVGAASSSPTASATASSWIEVAMMEAMPLTLEKNTSSSYSSDAQIPSLPEAEDLGEMKEYDVQEEKSGDSAVSEDKKEVPSTASIYAATGLGLPVDTPPLPELAESQTLSGKQKEDEELFERASTPRLPKATSMVEDGVQITDLEEDGEELLQPVTAVYEIKEIEAVEAAPMNRDDKDFSGIPDTHHGAKSTAEATTFETTTTTATLKSTTEASPTNQEEEDKMEINGDTAAASKPELLGLTEPPAETTPAAGSDLKLEQTTVPISSNSNGMDTNGDEAVSVTTPPPPPSQATTTSEEKGEKDNKRADSGKDSSTVLFCDRYCIQSFFREQRKKLRAEAEKREKGAAEITASTTSRQQPPFVNEDTSHKLLPSSSQPRQEPLEAAAAKVEEEHVVVHVDVTNPTAAVEMMAEPTVTDNSQAATSSSQSPRPSRGQASASAASSRDGKLDNDN